MGTPWCDWYVLWPYPDFTRLVMFIWVRRNFPTMVILPSAFMAEIHDLNRFSNETWCNIPKKSHGALGLSINQSCLVQPTPKMMKLVLYRTESRRFIMPDNWDIHGCTPSLSPSSICSLCDWMMCVYIYSLIYIALYTLILGILRIDLESSR